MYAATFDQHLTQGLQYNAPAELAALIAATGATADASWRVYIAPKATYSFTNRLQNVTSGEINVEVKLATGTTVQPGANTSVGEFYLRVSHENATMLIPFQLRLDPNGPVSNECVTTTGMPSNTYSMLCTL